MDTLAARIHQPTLLAFATLVTALIALAIAGALTVALAGGVDLIGSGGDVSPFRWG